MRTRTQVARATGELNLDSHEEARLYALYHAPRYRTVLDVAATWVRPHSRLLDVGRSPLTGMLRQRFSVRMDSLGFDPEGETDSGHHYHYDLNATVDSAGWRTDLPPYDLIVFAEVLEHLPTSPRVVLSYLRSLLSHDGHLILQTPNAVSLANRTKMLLGRNPFELIREGAGNPGHFREYTAAELRAYAAATGFDVVSLQYESYFDARYAHHIPGVRASRWAGLLNLVNRQLPPPLRPGITMVLAPASGGGSGSSVEPA